MPTAPNKLRACSLWLITAGLPLVFASGCPQIASDFTKSDTPFDTETSGANGGSSADGLGGGGGTTPSIDPDTATASGGSDTSTTASQGGTDTGIGGSGGNGGGSDVDTSTSTDTTTTSDTATSDTASSNTSSSDVTTANTTGSDTTTSSTTGGDTCTDEICDGLDNDCSGEPDDGEVCGWDAGCEGFEIDGHGYMFCGRPMSVDEAEINCSTQGMTLVQIDSEVENGALVEAADQRWNSEGGGGGNSGGENSNGNWGSWGGPGESQRQPAFWTGGSDVDSPNVWIWTGSGKPFWEGAGDGSPVGGAYSKWGMGRPNDSNDTPENCAAVYFREGEDGEVETWNDLPCADDYPSICETP